MLAAWAFASSGCDPAATRHDVRQLDVLPSEAPDASPASLLIEQQRRFIRALADPAGDPTPLMSSRFELVDWSDPTTQPGRGIAGQVAVGQDYLHALSGRVPEELAQIGAVEVLLDGPDRAAVISRHRGGSHSITHWIRENPGWRATILILNVPADVTTRARRRSVRQP